MTLKGKVFTELDLPNRLKPGLTKDQIDAWCAQHTERYRIVAMDGDYPVIEEERIERILRRLQTDAQLVARAMVRLSSPDLRKAVLAAFNKRGELIDPLTPV